MPPSRPSKQVPTGISCGIDRSVDMVARLRHMARTNMGKRPRVSNTSKGKWVTSSQLAQNKDFRDRVSKFQKRPWIVEKGIEVPSFGETLVPEIVATRR
ncbi:hypothetical protein Ddye_023844 [Dipteronia dyeriana]|uniref:Uncharacterized protein n=1 Tax=Dipteronia dyeriana TaxID=168575 RepID=A0AAD9TUC0_9ROSI|nr:hypothetical protein Ddye_023844 [Dipteronia dyeriana]